MRNFLSVAGGVIAGAIIVALVEWVGHRMYAPPAGMDFSDPDAVRAMMKDIPRGALAMVLVAWALGAFVGGWVAAHFAKSFPAHISAGRSRFTGRAERPGRSACALPGTGLPSGRSPRRRCWAGDGARA